MNAHEFVTTLSKIPSIKHIELMEGMGLPREFILEYVESYKFKKIIEKQACNKDPIIELVENYIGDSVKIGMITFDIPSDENVNQKYYFFGRFETDVLAIHNETGEILLLDYEDFDHIIYYCALGGTFFLDAIALAARFLEKLPFDDRLSGDQLAICEIAGQCSTLGGGNKYHDFYKTLLGCNT